jgi:hypothetical protein
MLLAEFLDAYRPPVIKSAPVGQREVDKVSTPQRPRLDGVVVELWHEFMPQTNAYIDTLRETAGTTEIDDNVKYYHRVPSNESLYSEVKILVSIMSYVANPLSAMTAIEGHGEVSLNPLKPGLCALDPDLTLSDYETDAVTGQTMEILRAVIELKTPWSFPPVPNGDLAAAYRDALSAKSNNDATEIECAICQLWGYMTVNQLKYGALSTYDKTYFFCRQQHSESDSAETLFISPAILLTSEQPSIMHAWMYFIHLTRNGHSFPYPVANRFEFEFTRDTESLYTACDISLNDVRLLKTSVGFRLNVGKDGTEQWVYAKTFNTLDDETASERLNLEVTAYRKLHDLQGVYVPEFMGCYLASGFMFIILLSDCGKSIGEDQPLPGCSRLKEIFSAIHAAGVVHGDVARRNISIDDHGCVRVIDFDHAILKDGATTISDEDWHQMVADEDEIVTDLLA